MKATLFAVALVMLVGRPVGARAQDMESASMRADKALAVALWQVAVATHTRIGFESVEAINTIGGVFRGAPSVAPSSLDDALDAAIAANPRYEWRHVGDAVVVRPAGAWTEATDTFNRPVRHFRAERTNESQVLHGIAALIETGTYSEVPLTGTAVDFTVESGTLIDVLDGLAASANIVFWQAGCAPREQGPRVSLSLSLVNEYGLRATMQRPDIRAHRRHAN